MLPKRALLLAGLALAAVTCRDGGGPDPRMATLAVHVAVGSAAVTSIVVEVTAADIPTPIAINLTPSGGTASGSINVPVGTGRTVTVHAFTQTLETHRGSAVITVVNGPNPTLTITVFPLSSGVPIEVTVGNYVVTVSPADNAISVAATVQLSVVVTDGVSPIPAPVTWASLSPGIASVDAGGLVHGLAPGEATIVASYGGAAGTAHVLVNPAGSAPPIVTINPLSGVGHPVVVVDYTLADATADVASVLVEFSADGGGTWATATRSGMSGEGVTGLATSAGGTAHTFFWAALGDGVGTSGPVSTVKLRITPSDAATGATVTTAAFTVNTNLQEWIGQATGIFPRNAVVERTGEVAVGDLVADALRTRAGTQLALADGGGIRAPLPSAFVATNPSLNRTGTPPLDLVAGDVYALWPFNNRMVTRTITGAQLWAALENGVSHMPTPNGAFPQISGFSFTWQPANVPGSRVVSVTLAGGGPIPADGTVYTIVTYDFIATGGDGYSMFDGSGTYREIIADVLYHYIKTAGTISPVIVGRITALP